MDRRGNSAQKIDFFIDVFRFTFLSQLKMSHRKWPIIFLVFVIIGVCVMFVSSRMWLFQFSFPIEEIDLGNIPIVPIAAVDSIVPIVPNANDTKRIQNFYQQSDENRINIGNSSHEEKGQIVEKTE